MTAAPFTPRATPVGCAPPARHAGGATRPARRRGLTLIEVMIVMALLALMATMALPTLGDRLGRQRLTSLSETLAMDLAEARVESAQSGQPLHLVFSRDRDWCYAVARTPDCGCATAQPCQLKTERASDWPGITLAHADDVALLPVGTPDLGARTRFVGVGGQHDLQVSLSPLGRARLCSHSGLAGQPAC